MNKRVIVVRFEDSVAIVDAAHAGIVAPCLSFTGHTFHSWRGVVTGRQNEEVLGRVVGGRFRFPAKLVGWVRKRLASLGHALELQDFPFANCRPDPAVLATLPEPAKTIFKGSTNNFGGMIKSGSGAHPETLIPMMLHLFPRYRTVLAVRNRCEEDRWLWRLRNEGLVQRVCGVSDLREIWHSEPKVFVCSFAKLDSCQRIDFDVAMVPNILTLADNARWDPDSHERYRWDFNWLRKPTVPAFGFLPHGYRPSMGESLRLTAIFGQTICSPGRDRSCVKVHQVPFQNTADSLSPEETRKDPARFKHFVIWANLERNRFVACLAEKYVTANPTNRIAILVENPCHARQLSEMLPDWGVRSQGGCPATSEQGSNLIITDFWASTCGELDVDTLIDARGTRAVELRGFPRLANGSDDSVTLVDVVDLGNPTLAANARRRHKQYFIRSWHAIEEGALADRVYPATAGS